MAAAKTKNARHRYEKVFQLGFLLVAICVCGRLIRLEGECLSEHRDTPLVAEMSQDQREICDSGAY